jgi:hypothetical protein
MIATSKFSYITKLKINKKKINKIGGKRGGKIQIKTFVEPQPPLTLY